MSGYIAFVKKEFIENMKNYRFLIMFAVFLIFGITSAFLAKFTPEILSALAADMEMSSKPVALDAWKQFYKNDSSLLVLALSLINHVLVYWYILYYIIITNRSHNLLFDISFLACIPTFSTAS